MRSFTTVKPTYWNGETGREIRDRGGKDAQLLGLYLLTNPHVNMIGLYYLPRVTIGRELALSEPDLTRAWTVLEDLRYAHYDATTSMVWVVEMAHHQIGHSLRGTDRKTPTIERMYVECPLNPFLGPFFDRYHDAFRLAARRDGTKTIRRDGIESLRSATSINTEHSHTLHAPYPSPDPDLVLDQSSSVEEKDIVRPRQQLTAGPPLDRWVRELVEVYPAQARTAGYLTESAFADVFASDGRPADAVWAELRANLENQKSGYQWAHKRMVPRLDKWLRDGLWRQRHDPYPPTAVVSERNMQNEIAGEAFVRGGRR